jgi:hypothetical protein
VTLPKAVLQPATFVCEKKKTNTVDKKRRVTKEGRMTELEESKITNTGRACDPHRQSQEKNKSTVVKDFVEADVGLAAFNPNPKHLQVGLRRRTQQPFSAVPRTSDACG